MKCWEHFVVGRWDLLIQKEFLGIFRLQSICRFANFFVLLDFVGQVAQLVEQRTENPCVGGSNPILPIFKAWLHSYLRLWSFFYFISK